MRACGPGRRPAGRESCGRRWSLGGASGRSVVRIERNQRSWLIRWEFLADFACGFRGIGSASGASSHAAFNTFVLIPEYHTSPRALQMVCTPSHTVLYRKRHPSGERSFVHEQAGSRAFSFAAVDRSVTIKGLVESPSGQFQTPNNFKLKPQPHRLRRRNTHGSKGWYQRLRPNWPQRFARRAWQSQRLILLPSTI